jgi:acyl-CoA thioester hydrolase
VTDTFTTEIRVRYSETDQMGIVYHANYLAWFEVGRTEWLRNLGRTYRDLEAEGLRLPVTEVGCKYHQSARYDDLVRVTTWIESYRKVRLRFGYEVHREDGALLVSGFTEHVFVGAEGQVVRLPKTHPELYEMLASKARDRG